MGGDLWRCVVALVLLGVVVGLSNLPALLAITETFRVYVPGARDYTAANVQGDACPFADDDVARAALTTGAGAALGCRPNGVGLGDEYYDDHGAPGVAAFCLEEPARALSTGSPSVADTLSRSGTVPAIRLEAPTIQALMAAAQGAVKANSLGLGTTYPLLMVAQQNGYGGAVLTASRADGFSYAAASAGQAAQQTPKLVGLLGVFRSMDARLAVEGALSTAYASQSRMCEMQCAGDAGKRCGCASGAGAATCMASTVDYTDYKSPLNQSTYWIAYRLQWSAA